MYPRSGVRTVNVANLTNGYAAEKGISKEVSDGEWKPYVFVFLPSTVGTVARYVVAHRCRTYYVTFLKPLLPAIKLLLWLNH